MRNNVTWADLVACARRVGVEVVEAPSSHRGKLGAMGSVRGLTCHHTGTANTFKPADDYPDFNVVKEGRTGLENSLSAFGIGRHRAIYVFSEFLSYHAGVWNWLGFTDGNGDFLGIECAGVGDYTDFQRKVYPRLVASLLLFLGETTDMAPRHLDGAMPRGRKSDAAGFQTAFHNGMNFYDSVKFFMANPALININAQGDEDDMQLTERVWVGDGTASVTVAEALAAAYEAGRGLFDIKGPDGKPTGGKINLGTFLSYFDNNMKVQSDLILAQSEAIRALAAARGDDFDVDGLLGRIEGIVKANRAELNVTVGEA